MPSTSSDSCCCCCCCCCCRSPPAARHSGGSGVGGGRGLGRGLGDAGEFEPPFFGRKRRCFCLGAATDPAFAPFSFRFTRKTCRSKNFRSVLHSTAKEKEPHRKATKSSCVTSSPSSAHSNTFATISATVKPAHAAAVAAAAAAAAGELAALLPPPPPPPPHMSSISLGTTAPSPFTSRPVNFACASASVGAWPLGSSGNRLRQSTSRSASAIRASSSSFAALGRTPPTGHTSRSVHDSVPAPVELWCTIVSSASSSAPPSASSSRLSGTMTYLVWCCNK